MELQSNSIFSAHHQEFSAVHSALVGFMQVFDYRFQAESGWNCSAVFCEDLIILTDGFYNQDLKC